MLDPKKYDKDTLRWRDKYFSLSDEVEKNERGYADYLGVLQKALVRISLAAEGQDGELDKQLSSLRALLRKDSVDQVGIRANLKQVERVILRLDTQRKEGGHQGMESLLQLIERLAQLNLSGDKQRALKRYGKTLSARRQQLSAYPELLNEYSRRQSEALAESIVVMVGTQETPTDKPNKGLFSRFFGSNPEPRSADNISVQSVDADKAGNSPEPGHGRGSVDELLDAGGESEQVMGLEPVITVLAELLEQLPLPADERQQAEQLRDQLAARVEAGELDQVVDGAAELVLEALDKTQRDFEQFLLTLDKQLAEINGFLGSLDQSDGALKSSGQQLNTAVLGQVKSISQAMNEASDLDDLKASVQNQLNAIENSMDDFVIAETQREKALEEQLQVMQEQLEIVQSEARVISEKLHNETLRALTDVLTGLPNREAFDERLSMERERDLRYKHAASLAILDIDHFKEVNDQHGHLVGDRVLQHVARTLKETVRKTDFLARYGGEEFVLIMPESTLESAGQVLEKVRLAVASMSLGELGAVTISAGLAAFQRGEDVKQLVERADKALYHAKEKGRNRVEIAES